MNNPATKWLEWKSGKKAFQYYDKETKENIEVPFPVEFSVIHQGTGIKGYNKQIKKGIVSNEIIKHDEVLNVRYYEGDDIATGKWKSIEGAVKKAGGRYCKFVYAVMNGEIVCLTLMGVALSWFDDSNEIQLSESVVKVEQTTTTEFQVEEDGVKKTVVCNVPVYEYSRNLTKEEFMKKSEAEYDMKSYLEEYRKPKEEPKEDMIDYKPKTQVEDLPF